MPQIFEANDKWNDLRADRIGKEFGAQYIIKGGGNEYQRMEEIAATKDALYCTLNFPQAMDVEDPSEADSSLCADMKHWELAPTNPGAFEKANIPFCLTTADLKDSKQFFPNLRKAFDNGLSEAKAFEALTKEPATLLGVYDKVGSLEAGKIANFLILNGPLFNEKTTLLENWIQGQKYAVKDEEWNDIKGTYSLTLHSAAGSSTYALEVKTANSANVIGKDTLPSKFSFDGKLVKLSFSPNAIKKPRIRDSTAQTSPEKGRFGGAPKTGPSLLLSGVANGATWSGTGSDTLGNRRDLGCKFCKSRCPHRGQRQKENCTQVGQIALSL